MGDRSRDESEKGSRQVHITEVERLIDRLPGVVSCRLVVNDWGGIDEVHVLATRERNPKQIVRDVESCLAAKWSMAVDHKKISVAQVSDEINTIKAVRLQVESYSLTNHASSNRIKVEVCLACPREGAQFRGSSEGSNTPVQRSRTVALAALDALGKAIIEGYHLGLIGVHIVDDGAHRVAVVVGTLADSSGDQETVTGSSIMGEDRTGAIIRACLACLNRRLGKLYTARRGETWESGE